MDLEDSFTEKILTRRKATAAYISAKKAGTPSKSAQKRSALVEEQQISGGTVSDKVPEESPKRQCIEQPSKNSHENDKENVQMMDDSSEDQFIPFKASANRGLAALRRKNNLSDDVEEEETRTVASKPEETEESSPVKKVFKFNEKDSVSVSRDLFPKQPTNSNTFSQNILKNKVVPGNDGKAPPSTNTDLNRSLDPAELPLSARKALFEKSLFGAGGSRAGGSQSDEQPKLSIAQRAAMFEKAANGNYKPAKQNGSATKWVQPASPKKFESRNTIASPVKASPIKTLVHASPVKSAPLQPSPMKSAPVLGSPMKSAPVQASPLKSSLRQPSPLKNGHVQGSPMKSIQDELLSPVVSPMKEVSSHVRQIQQQLSEQQRTVTWQDEQRKKEVEEVANRHQRRQQHSSSSSHVPSGEEQSNSVHEDTEEYYEESASEIESVYTERETEFEDDGKMQEEESYEEEYPASNADNQEVFDPEDEDISDYVEPEEVEQQVQSRERKYRQVEYSNPDSDASSLRSSVSVSSSYVSKSPSCSSLSSTGSESRPEAPLQYTVSFYRRQKQASRTPPLRTIVRREQVEIPDATNDAREQAHIIQDQIKTLQEEILRQQTVIGQTSQALNLCHATAEFSGSSEQVEGERLLLIATQKRQACLNEIQRLKSHGAQNASVSEGMGTLTIADIQLPLKREFITAQLEGKLNDAVHCFLCLIRYGPQVIVTQMMSTSDKISDGALSFSNHIKLQALPPDFSVVFEVYALQTKKEHLPHDKKYHIRRDQSKMRLTPKGKKGESKLILPAIQSPGGPNTVRSSSFGVVGFTRFSIQNCHKRCFTLDKVPFASPLEGVLKIKLQLHAEHTVTQKGFLTMYEVVTGFGALYRRWCYLNAQYLAYWKYPEDEQKKEPIGMIDLKRCVTGEVKLLPRDICARPNTFELVTLTPKGEKETGQGNPLSITKHLLTADTKEERVLWCNKLNEALANVRKWDAQALKPVDTDNSAFVYPCSK